jgi:hypothetical protein
MPVTDLKDGSTHIFRYGSHGGFAVSEATALTISGAASTGADAYAPAHLPMISATDIKPGVPGVLVVDTSVLNVTSGTLTGGYGCPGTADRGDGIPNLMLPCFGAAAGILAVGDRTRGPTVNISGGTIQGGSYAVGAVGSFPMQGAPGLNAVDPASVTISGGAFTGGTSEPTLSGAPAVIMALSRPLGATLSGGSFTGGWGATQGPSLVVIIDGTGAVTVTGGRFSGPIYVALNVSGATIRFEGSLTWNARTKTLSGTLSDSSTIKVVVRFRIGRSLTLGHSQGLVISNDLYNFHEFCAIIVP